MAPMLLNRRPSLFPVIFFALLLSIQIPAVELYVSPEGNDSWSGTWSGPNPAKTDGPLATLVGARDALRKRDHSHEAADVVIADGYYEMSTPLELEPIDSGTVEFPVTYRAATGAKPVFSGGRLIKGWKQESGGLWTTAVPEVTAGHWSFEQLWINGIRATPARYPNKGFLIVSSVTESAISAEEAAQLGVPSNWTKQIIELKPSDLAPLAAASAAELAAVQFVAYQNWETTRRHLSGLDLVTGKFSVVAPRQHPASRLKAGSKYHLESARAFLDAPGEWYLDAGGVIHYKLRGGENMPAAQAIAPRLETFLVLKGNPAAGCFVERLAFKGLTFAYEQWITPERGVDPGQAAYSIEAAIMADGARHISVEACEIAHTGKYAAWFRNGCDDISIRRCYLHDLGAGGIRIGPFDIPANPLAQTTDVQLDNNIIRQGGRIFASAVGILIGQSGGNSITHNDISDFYYSGISVGWTWGYGPSSAVGNKIDYNRVHHLGWGLLNDMGGIYTLGVSPGTECIGNVIHHIAADTYGGWGIYFDEGSSDIRAEDNLVYATTHGGFHLHYGREDIVRNNIFALNRNAQLQLTRREEHQSLTFEHNIVFWLNGDLFAREWGRANIQSDANLFFRASDGFDKATLLATEAQGRDQHSTIADPSFRNPTQGDFFLPLDSPAFQVGFKSFDSEQAGVYGAAKWRRLAENQAQPKLPDWLERDPFASRQ